MIGHRQRENQMGNFESKQTNKKTILKMELSHEFSTNTKVNVQKCLKFPHDHNIVKSVGKRVYKGTKLQC